MLACISSLFRYNLGELIHSFFFFFSNNFILEDCSCFLSNAPLLWSTWEWHPLLASAYNLSDKNKFWYHESTWIDDCCLLTKEGKYLNRCINFCQTSLENSCIIWAIGLKHYLPRLTGENMLLNSVKSWWNIFFNINLESFNDLNIVDFCLQLWFWGLIWSKPLEFEFKD